MKWDWLRDFWWRLTQPHDLWMLQRRRENRRQDQELNRSIKRDLRNNNHAPRR